MELRWFDEIINSDGEIRDHYKLIYQKWQSYDLTQKNQLWKDTKKLTSNDYLMDPLPRILTYNEFHFLKRGVEQRAKAIHLFLCDYATGGRRYQRILPKSTLKEIMSRHHRDDVLPRQKPETISFPYGPDIIRDRNGSFKVLEDSAGMLGGFGDLMASKRVLSSWPELSKRALPNSHDPRQFYQELATHFKNQASKKNGIAVLKLRPFKDEVDHETYRLAKIFEGLGVQISVDNGRSNQLETKGNGIFLKHNNKRVKVGFLMRYAGPENDRCYQIQQLISDLIKPSSASISISDFVAPTLRDEIINGHALTNFSPGVWFINDKMFGLYVDNLIRVYLKEEPLLPSITAKSFGVLKNSKWCLDKKLLSKVISNKNDFVVKRVDQDGGEGVFIGPKMQQRSWLKITDKVKGEPHKFIVQNFEHLSLLEDRIVDMRIHTHVDSEKIITSNTPWGRANWRRGDGKVNISCNGFTSPVFVLSQSQEILH